jgi:predicted  nucleic acid-binding Zn-ribbon protein
LLSHSSLFFSVPPPSASLSDELVRVTSLSQSHSAALARIPTLESQLTAATRRLDAALQVIGEKEDELEELRGDMSSAKQSFKEQIQQLADELLQLKRQNGTAAPAAAKQA